MTDFHQNLTGRSNYQPDPTDNQISGLRQLIEDFLIDTPIGVEPTFHEFYKWLKKQEKANDQPQKR